MSNLLIVGAGQFGVMVKEIAHSLCRFDKIDFIDDNSEMAIGSLDDCERLFDQYRNAVVAIGDPELREAYTQRLKDIGFDIVSVISPCASVSPSATVMGGAIIEPLAAVQSHSVISTGTIVSSGAIIRHDALVGAYCHIDCNSVVMSGSAVDPGSKVDACSVYHNNKFN